MRTRRTYCRRMRALLMVLTGCALVAGLVAAPAAAVTAEDLEGAWVPALCGHPAGYLVDGALPEDDDPLNGGVWLGRTATGPLAEDGADWGVAQLFCNAGGVGWSDTVAFYEPDGTLHRAFDLYDITHGGREIAARLTIADGQATVRVVGIAQDGDPACCGTRSAVLTFAWSAEQQQVALTGKRTYTERATAAKLVKALNHKRKKKVRALASPSMTRDLLRMRRYADSHVRLLTCFGSLDERFPFDYGVARGCEVRISNRYGSYTYVLGMDQRGWRTWKVTEGSYSS